MLYDDVFHMSRLEVCWRCAAAKQALLTRAVHRAGAALGSLSRGG